MASIYALCDPDTAEVRYIGKANDPAGRLRSHIRDCRRRKTPVYDWISKLLSAGKAPEMFVVRHECANWQGEERHLIAKARAFGMRLLNVADGGDEPHCPTEVRRANAKKANESRTGGMRGYWAMMRIAGALVRRWADMPEKAEKVAKLRDNMAYLRAQTPEMKEAAGNAWLARGGGR